MILCREKCTPQPEKSVNVSWAELLENEQLWPMSLASPMPGEEVFLVNNMLLDSECARIILASEEIEYGRTNYPQKYRGNLRIIAEDTSLSSELWRRLKDVVPSAVEENGFIWEAVGLNECFRYAKYYPTDVFQSHCDACFYRNNDEKSMFTVNIYLNGLTDFSGGRTRFFHDNSDRIVFAVDPTPGLCLIFRQPPGAYLTHDGERVESGFKYLCRSDVMYRRLRPVNST